jgi:hypothetical protein
MNKKKGGNFFFLLLTAIDFRILSFFIHKKIFISIYNSFLKKSSLIALVLLNLNFIFKKRVYLQDLKTK